MKRILVTGGAGYIGSHTVHLLLSRGYDVVVVDDLSNGHPELVSTVPLHVLKLQDTDALTRLLVETRCDAVVHFAARIEVGESMKKPALYFENNTYGSLSLIQAMLAAGVHALVYSSTAAVYGTPTSQLFTETSPLIPVNPYGESKLATERMLRWFDEIHGLKSIALRYFNASGAAPGGKIGENHSPETHLIPLLFRAIRTGKPITIFGEDYPTPDGTCIRDYVHVDDLATAHILALEHLAGGAPSDHFNVGTGVGHSVRDVIRAVEQTTGAKVPSIVGSRRLGDPAVLVANADTLTNCGLNFAGSRTILICPVSSLLRGNTN